MLRAVGGGELEASPGIGVFRLRGLTWKLRLSCTFGIGPLGTSGIAGSAAVAPDVLPSCAGAPDVLPSCCSSDLEALASPGDAATALAGVIGAASWPASGFPPRVRGRGATCPRWWREAGGRVMPGRRPHVREQRCTYHVGGKGDFATGCRELVASQLPEGAHGGRVEPPVGLEQVGRVRILENEGRRAAPQPFLNPWPKTSDSPVTPQRFGLRTSSFL